ncbi:alpha-L-fucosidase [Glycomyces artemisiae]|uniref:alpha-L-fucosidase n=1 Tax=Glycomyces artemisiae TaxID=1076443 RepID=A0A2T0UDR6_9ACTN|nr:alpha-L-fucosidase [Glycomyces artemisiae]PRY56024.1 alpha-L-fucosidase [Glycomyces artemisiae]
MTDDASAYEPTWASVERHDPVPEWLKDAKFGIYFHWGAYSAPAFQSEWYPRHMHVPDTKERAHHEAVYGDPADWPYHRFIDGGTDREGRHVQFKPRLTADGGAFDPDAWAALFAAAGARFAGLAAEHHDGYSLWPSETNEWNSVDRGPGLDLVGLHADAIRSAGLRFMVYMHHAYHFTGYFDHVAPQTDPSLRKLYGQLGKAEHERLWVDRLKEVIDRYRPELICQDFNLDKLDEASLLEFLAYYYNRESDWGTQVATTYKDGMNDRAAMFDYERGGPAGLHEPYWLTDDSISDSSWCYTEGIGYYPVEVLVHSLVDRVAKGGTMLLNVAPTAEGVIPPEQREILLGIGDYLARFGESVYDTRPWTVFGEGPTTMGGGNFVAPVRGTSGDLRFTRSKDGTVLYATVLDWPGTELAIPTLAAGRIDLTGLRRALLLGPAAGAAVDLPGHRQDDTGLHLALPAAEAPFASPAYVVKLEFADRVPDLATD